MAIKHVQESLGQFNDYKYFSLLEAKKEKEKVEESGSEEDVDEYKEEDEKDGLDVVQKLRDNLERFKAAAGEKIMKFKEFWEENQAATDGFDEEGELYKLWDSDYVAGVLTLPDQALTDEELNAAIEQVDDESPESDSDEDEEKEEEGEEDEEKEEDEEDEEKEEDEDEEDDDEKEEEDEDEEDEDEELEEGNAFSGALKNAKKKGKKDFKVGGKKYPVKESLMPVGEDFPLFEEMPAEDVVTPDEESEEEKEELENKPEEPQLGFSLGDEGDEPEGEEDIVADLDGDGVDDEAEVEDGEAIELDGDLDGDGTEEGGMEFGEEGGESEYFVVYNTNGSGREETFRCSSPKVIDSFKDFFENEFKAAIRDQIQRYKEAQEEKQREAERIAKEEKRASQKEKLDKFMKD